MKKFTFLCVLLVLIACNNEEPEIVPETTLSELDYPAGTGTSGDKKFSVVGYGFDATGLCDTISVRAKISEIPQFGFVYAWGGYASSEIRSNGSLSNFLENLDNLPLKSHISRLLSLASNTSKDVHVVYYSTYMTNFFGHTLGSAETIKQYLTSNFKNDIDSLSPSELVLKYGTHVLASIYTGKKFEIIYTCETKKFTSDYDLEQQFLSRFTQLFGGSIFTILTEYTCKSSYFDEKVIYNTIGSQNKLFGLINVTNNNPKGIKVDYNSFYSDESTGYKFSDIWSEDGLVSLDNLIDEPIKKQEVKEYIEEYINSKSLLIGE